MVDDRERKSEEAVPPRSSKCRSVQPDVVATLWKLIRSSDEDDLRERSREDRRDARLATAFASLCSFRCVTLRFWNQILTWWSLSFSPAATSSRSGRAR